MATTAIIELLPMNEVDNKSIAHIRIARFINNIIADSVILNKPEDFKLWWDKPIDNLVIMYASRFYAYGSFKFIEEFVRKHTESKLFWCINEYNLVPNSGLARLFKERGVHIVANFVSDGLQFKHFTEFTRVNLNVTAYRRNAKILSPEERRYDLLYYGTYRPDRETYFKEYLSDAVVSTSIKNIPKFRKLAPRAQYIDKLTWMGGKCFLRNFRFSLYIEDKFTHDHFNFLADRFYEALSYDVILLFDKRCENSLEKSGYPVSREQIVESSVDAKEIISEMKKDYPTYLAQQQLLKNTFESEFSEVKRTLRQLFE